MKIYVVGTHYKCLIAVFLMSTHNIYFCGEIRKISFFFFFFFVEKHALTEAMAISPGNN